MQPTSSISAEDEAARLVNETARFLRFLANWLERNGLRVVCKLLK
jgi:hypothetical protein